MNNENSLALSRLIEKVSSCCGEGHAAAWLRCSISYWLQVKSWIKSATGRTGGAPLPVHHVRWKDKAPGGWGAWKQEDGCFKLLWVCAIVQRSFASGLLRARQAPRAAVNFKALNASQVQKDLPNVNMTKASPKYSEVRYIFTIWHSLWSTEAAFGWNSVRQENSELFIYVFDRWIHCFVTILIY